jgi:flagellar basal body-associated protein FliL
MPEAANIRPPQMDSPGAKKSDSKPVLIAVVAVLCAALAAGAYSLMTRRATASSQAAATPAAAQADGTAPVATLKLDSFLVNLADADHNSFLRVGITLGLGKKADAASGSATIPELRDAILSVLTTWQSSELLDPAGKSKLKEQLLTTLQRRIPQVGVTGIYFTDFLIQQ